MSEASSFPSRLEFSSDLRRIREERGLTLEALYEKTKIPLSVLQDFEETGLFDNPVFNRVYLRSLVRTYALFVDIPSKVALQGLDEALLDSYKGRLATAFLGKKPPEDQEMPEAEAPEAEVPEPQTPEAEAEKPPEKPVAKAPVVQEKVKTPTVTTSRLLTTASSWESRSLRSRWHLVDIKELASYTQWILIVGAVFAFSAAIWAVITLIDRPVGAEQQQAAPVDTATVVAVEPSPPPITIGDTLDFVVVAAQKVERIHITRDEDARRPYWIEQGRANAYPALERIILEDRLDRIGLLVEGYPYPIDQLDERGRLVITRAAVEAFVDTITTVPVPLPVAPDTIRLFPIR